MQAALTAISIAVYALIVVLHILSVVLCDFAQKIIKIANITLHIALVFLLLFSRVSLDLVALCFVASLFVYTLSSFIYAKMKKRRASSDASKEVEI